MRKDLTPEEMKAFRNSFCKHYDGREIFSDGQFCRSEINVREIVAGDDLGWMTRIPCNSMNKTEITCDKFQDRTLEELQKEADDMEAAVQRVLKADKLITQLKKDHPKGGSGFDTCPACEKSIQWCVSSYNGHISLVCETENCIKLME